VKNYAKYRRRLFDGTLGGVADDDGNWIVRPFKGIFPHKIDENGNFAGFYTWEEIKWLHAELRKEWLTS
jgi:hypothetical protein